MPTTVLDLRRFKDEGQRFVMLTCYDFQCAQIFDEVGIPLIFIGDTLGIFVLGYDTTIPVLEAVPTEAAKRVTEVLGIPTIGIGAGPHCDGQVLFSTEMLGLNAGHQPRFAKRYADHRGQISLAARTFAEEVAKGEYPDHEHSYDWAIR